MGGNHAARRKTLNACDSRHFLEVILANMFPSIVIFRRACLANSSYISDDFSKPNLRNTFVGTLHTSSSSLGETLVVLLRGANTFICSLSVCMTIADSQKGKTEEEDHTETFGLFWVKSVRAFEAQTQPETLLLLEPPLTSSLFCVFGFPKL